MISSSPWLQPSLYEIVAQRRRQIPHGTIGFDAERAVPLREFGAVGTVDQRHMGVDRRVPPERLEDLRLPRRVGEMVVAANDVGDVHVVVVDDDRKIVGRGSVAAQDHEIVEFLIAKDDTSLHAILDHGFAFARGFEADRGLDSGRRLGRVAIAPSAVIAGRAALGAGLLAHGSSSSALA